MNLYNHTINLLETEGAFKLADSIRQLEKQNKDVVKLNIGDPDFHVPEFVVAEIKHQLDINNSHYCDPKGIYPLREVICEHIKQKNNIDFHPEQVVIFPGAKTAIGFCQQVYCNPGDEVIYPVPGFPVYEIFTKYWGSKAIPISLDESTHFKLTPEQLSQYVTKKTKLIYLNFPSNPTGAVLTEKELESLAEVILSKCHKNVRIFSDEIYEDLIYDNKPHRSIAQIPQMRDRTIISSGFSKNFAWTGGRVGYSIFPTIEEADAFKNLNTNYFACVPPYHQCAAITALTHPDSQKYLQSVLTEYQHRRDIITELLNDIKGVSCHLPEGALYLYPNITQVCEHLGITHTYQHLSPHEKALTAPATLFQLFALFQHQVGVLDQRSFGTQQNNDKSHVRLTLTAPLSVLKEGVKRMNHATQDVQGFQEYLDKKMTLYL